MRDGPAEDDLDLWGGDEPTLPARVAAALSGGVVAGLALVAALFG